MIGRYRLRFFLICLLLYFSVLPTTYADGNSPIRIVDQNMIVYPLNEETLQILMNVTFVNNGEEKEKELPVFLPPGYQELELGDDLSLEQTTITDRGIVDASGLDPQTEKRLTLSFQMPLKAGESRWAIEQSYVTDSFKVIIPQGRLSFQALRLTPQSESLDIEGQPFRRFTRVDVHPDETWTVLFRLLADKDGQKPADGDQETSAADDKRILAHEHGAGYGKVAFTFAVILTGFTFVVIGLGREKYSVSRRSMKARYARLLAEKKRLLEQISRVEQDFTSQRMREEDYISTRKQLKGRLIRVMLKLRRVKEE